LSREIFLNQRIVWIFFRKSTVTSSTRRSTTTTTVYENDVSTGDEAREDYSFERTIKPNRRRTTSRGPGIMVSFPEAKHKVYASYAG
jgi:hypothetical protein